MATSNKQTYEFGDWRLDPAEHLLLHEGEPVPLTPKVFETLLLLVENSGRLVSKDEFMRRVWPDSFVEDLALTQNISQLRKALGDSVTIETVPKMGYRLLVPVTGGVPASGQLVEEVRAVRPKIRGRRLYYRLMPLAAVMLAVGALALLETFSRTPDAPKVLRFVQLTNDGHAKTGPLATDGSRIYFNEVLPGPTHIIVQVSVKGGDAVPLSVPLKQPKMLDLSKEENELLIESTEEAGYSSLWLQPVAGGSPRRVGTVLVRGGAKFGPDGTSIIYADEHEVYSVSLDGSSLRKILTIDGFPSAFRFSPDARVFRFSRFDNQNNSEAIMEAAADGTGLREMFQGCCGEWTPDGRFFIFQKGPDSNSDLWALPEERRFRWRRRDDKPIQLTAGPLSFEDSLPSQAGKAMFAIGESHRAEVIRYDSRDGQFVPYLSGISAEGLAFSRDGQWVTYTSFPDGSLWRSKLDGSERLQLTFPPMRALLPSWSPNGKQIAFCAILPGVTWNIYLVSSEGGTAQRVLPSEWSQMDATWSPDGNSLVFGTHIVPNAPIYTVDLRSKRVSTLPGSNGLFSPRWSPDGLHIVAITTQRPFKLMLFDFGTEQWTELYGNEVGFPSWSLDGKYLYFKVLRRGLNVPERIVRLRLSDRKTEDIVDVKSVGRMTTGTIVPWFGLAPDDSPLFARDISTAEIYALEMNWP